MARAVLFDANGTLFDLAAAREELVALGAPPAALEAWFQRLLHSAATVTLTDEYRPFAELAAPALATTLAQLGLDPSSTGPFEALSRLGSQPEAARRWRACTRRARRRSRSRTAGASRPSGCSRAAASRASSAA